MRFTFHVTRFKSILIVNHLKRENKKSTKGCLNLYFEFDIRYIPCAASSKTSVTMLLVGLVGDLISGEIDISVATLTMTTEREEVIDFVSPYFDQVIDFIYYYLIMIDK